MRCTRFRSIKTTKPQCVVDLVEVLKEISTDKYKKQIEEIRIQENPSKTPLKDKLPVFTPTGEFSHRSIKGIEFYNGIICLDIDNIENPELLKSKCKNLNYVFSAFITPSGKGLKVLIKSPATPENYREIEELVAKAFYMDTGAIRDKHCKDIARIQFVSYDPDIYINENSITIKLI